MEDKFSLLLAEILREETLSCNFSFRFNSAANFKETAQLSAQEH